MYTDRSGYRAYYYDDYGGRNEDWSFEFRDPADFEYGSHLQIGDWYYTPSLSGLLDRPDDYELGYWQDDYQTGGNGGEDGRGRIQWIANDGGRRGERTGYIVVEQGIVGTYEDYLKQAVPQDGAIMATNLYKGYDGPNTPENIAFWKEQEDATLDLMPGIGFFNYFSKAFTGTNLNGDAKEPSSPFEAMAPSFGKVATTGTKVFRAVDATEAAIIKNTGKFSLQQGGVEAKYFAKSLEDAHWYGQRLYPNGYSIIQATVKEPLNASQYWFQHVDIGAYVFPKQTLPYIIPH